MSSVETSVCPWCHTEIVWDEEWGPEETCPHCMNELNEYRTIEVTISPSESPDELMDVPDERSGINEVAEPYFWDGEMSGSERELLRYEQTVEQIINGQDEVMECPNCRQMMLHAGEQMVEASQFASIVPETIDQPLLQAPYRLNVFVCPVCFQVGQALSETDRHAMLRRLSDVQKKDE